MTTRSLLDFQKNSEEHLHRLKQTGEPEILTVNGRPEVVVQSASAYQELLEKLDYSETVAVLKARMAAADAGEEAIPADRVLEDIAHHLRSRRA